MPMDKDDKVPAELGVEFHTPCTAHVDACTGDHGVPRAAHTAVQPVYPVPAALLLGTQTAAELQSRYCSSPCAFRGARGGHLSEGS